MAAGLVLWDGSGNVVLDTAHRLTRVLGAFESGISDGSLTSEGFAQGTPWHVRLTPDLGLTPPKITVTGNTLSWTFGNVAAEFRRSAFIMYGVY